MRAVLATAFLRSAGATQSSILCASVDKDGTPLLSNKQGTAAILERASLVIACHRRGVTAAVPLRNNSGARRGDYTAELRVPAVAGLLHTWMMLPAPPACSCRPPARPPPPPARRPPACNSAARLYHRRASAARLPRRLAARHCARACNPASPHSSPARRPHSYSASQAGVQTGGRRAAGGGAVPYQLDGISKGLDNIAVTPAGSGKTGYLFMTILVMIAIAKTCPAVKFPADAAMVVICPTNFIEQQTENMAKTGVAALSVSLPSFVSVREVRQRANDLRQIPDADAWRMQMPKCRSVRKDDEMSRSPPGRSLSAAAGPSKRR
ncbi:hypothetical protein GGX14DRAFT_655045 [Mycena pura]|uniref:DEAD/DEAH box helicase domain-containing protein n=1 Tax=Mycena pura TaxID=153505 RepID=A0AAD6V453_9AGAR|nr:hypothetical protein GGX14DRAFT_655045 [Mycena pura]